jgi:hypothetical protein
MSAFQRPDARAWFPVSVAAWSQHTAKLCKLYEGVLRVSTAAATAANATGPVLDTLLKGFPRAFMRLPEPTGVGAFLQGALAAPPGSKQQKQLLSLLFSYLKVAPRLPISHYAKAQELRIAAALAAAAAMHKLTAAAVAEEVAGCTSSGGSSVCGYSGNSSVGCQTAPQAMLPWLALFGRCCLQWSQLLQWEQANGRGGERSLQNLAATSAGPLVIGFMSLRNTADICIFLQPACLSWEPAASDAPPLWSVMYKACLLCLKNPAVAAQMRSAGVEAGTCWTCCGTQQTACRRPAGVLGQGLGRAAVLGCWRSSSGALGRHSLPLLSPTPATTHTALICQQGQRQQRCQGRAACVGAAAWLTSAARGA